MIRADCVCPKPYDKHLTTISVRVKLLTLMTDNVQHKNEIIVDFLIAVQKKGD